MRRNLLLLVAFATLLPISPLVRAQEAAPAVSQPSAAPDSFIGKVVSVSDGDTLSVLRDGKAVTIRLHGIDAPETGQAFGAQAKKTLSDLVFDREVIVEVRDTDKYGRLVGIVSVGETNANRLMVKSGMAWWYHQYGAADKPLALLEIDARATRVGLWKAGNPTPPWAFRNSEAEPQPAFVPPVREPEGSLLSTPASVPILSRDRSLPGAAPPAETGVESSAAVSPAAAPETTGVYLSRSGSKYHVAGCRYLSKSQIPRTLGEATKQGFTACRVCSPPVLATNPGIPQSIGDQRSSPSPSTPSPTVTAPPTSSGDVQVRGYYRKDGTYVRPHTRSRPGSGRSRRR